MIKALIVSEGPHDRAVEDLIRRLVTSPLEADHDRVSNPLIHTHHGKGQGFFKRLVRWIREAKRRGYDALVLVIDRDGDPERVRQVDRAQEYTVVEFPRALGVAIESFDAWMLADEKALSAVLGYSVARQKSPESIGKPKQACEHLLASSSLDLPQRDMYRAICDAVDIGKLTRRCPKGFRPFAARVRALF